MFLEKVLIHRRSSEYQLALLLRQAITITTRRSIRLGVWAFLRLI